MAITTDIFGSAAFAQPMIMFRAFLVESGFLWIIWLVVAVLAFAFMRAVMNSQKELHENFGVLLYPFIMGIMSWLATGSAIIMALPVFIGFVAFAIGPRMIRGAIRSGKASQKMMRGWGKQRAAEQQEEGEEKRASILESQEYSLTGQKFRLIQALAQESRGNVAAMAPTLNAIQSVIKNQLNVLFQEEKIEKQEKKSEKKEVKTGSKLTKAEINMSKVERRDFQRMAPFMQRFGAQRWAYLNNLYAQLQNKEINQQQMEKTESAAMKRELGTTANVIKFMMKLMKLLRGQLSIVNKLSKMKTLTAFPIVVQNLYKKCQEEVPLMRTLAQDESMKRAMEKQEEGLTSRIYQEESQEFMQEKIMQQVLAPFRKQLKKAGKLK